MNKIISIPEETAKKLKKQAIEAGMSYKAYIEYLLVLQSFNPTIFKKELNK